MSFTLRLATLFDIDAIMKIESLSFIPQIQEERDVFISRIKLCPNLFLVFEEKSSQKVVGYLSAEYMQKIPQSKNDICLGHIPNINLENSKNYIYISSFALLPEYRGGGNGKQLFAQSLEWFKKSENIESFLLLVNEKWHGAKHIYETLGFETINVFENFFPNESGNLTENGLLMKNVTKHC